MKLQWSLTWQTQEERQRFTKRAQRFSHQGFAVCCARLGHAAGRQVFSSMIIRLPSHAAFSRCRRHMWLVRAPAAAVTRARAALKFQRTLPTLHESPHTTKPREHRATNQRATQDTSQVVEPPQRAHTRPMYGIASSPHNDPFGIIVHGGRDTHAAQPGKQQQTGQAAGATAGSEEDTCSLLSKCACCAGPIMRAPGLEKCRFWVAHPLRPPPPPPTPRHATPAYGRCC